MKGKNPLNLREFEYPDEKETNATLLKPIYIFPSLYVNMYKQVHMYSHMFYKHRLIFPWDLTFKKLSILSNCSKDLNVYNFLL